MRKIILVTVLVAILISTEECHACFAANETHNMGIFKTGSSIYKECACDDRSSAANLKWLDPKDQEIGPKGSEVYTERRQGALSLLISNVNKTLAGNYKCVARTPRGLTIHTYQVDVYNPLIFFNTAETQYLITGRDSLLICLAKGDNPPLITWHKDLEELAVSKDDDKYEIVSKGLLIKNADKYDEGIYKCTASVYKTGEEVDRFINAEVLKPPRIQDIKLNSSEVGVGDYLSVECIADGFPLPTYEWHKTSLSTVEAGKNNTWPKRDNVLVFESIEEDDRGTYQCLAKNNAGEDKKSLTIEVLTQPNITELYNITAVEGERVQLVCKATGRPRPLITMTFDGEITENDRRINYVVSYVNDTDTEYYLTFDKLDRSHAGLYTCDATNKVSNASKEMYLSVLYKPSFEKMVEVIWAWEEKPANLSCEHDSQPAADIIWRFQGSNNDIPISEQNEVNVIITRLTQRNYPLRITNKSQYGTYECTAKNHLGEAHKFFHVKEGFKPLEIYNVTVGEVKGASATFYIVDPPAAGPPLIGIAAEYDVAESYSVTNIHLNRTWAIGSQYKLDKLKPNTTYYIRFAGINEVGTGPFGELVTFDTPERSVPDAPSMDYDSNTSALKASDRSMVIRLKAAEDNGSPIQHFAVKYCPVDDLGADVNDNTCIRYTVPPTTLIHLKDLEHNTTYYLELTARNSEGNSQPTITHFRMPEVLEAAPVEGSMSGGAIIGTSIVVVVICLLLLDALLLLTKRQGMMASCCFKKNKKKEHSVQTRDKKGLLKDNAEAAPDDNLKRPAKSRNDFEYNNKPTVIITGKHSVV